MTEPLLPQLLKPFKHIGPNVIPILRNELCHHASGSFSPGVSKESICGSPADQYPIASPGGDDDTSMTSACSPDLCQVTAASSLLQISGPHISANSPRFIRPMSAPHHPPSTMHPGSTKTLDSTSDPNVGQSGRFLRSNSSHSEIPTIQAQTLF